jgi:hypothetical protein
MSRGIAMKKRTSDLDKIHKQRLKAFFAGRREEQTPELENIFVSERVHETLPKEKILLTGFDAARILAFLPFSKNIYVSVCRNCVQKENFSVFKPLVERGAIIPVLYSPYSSYGDQILNIIASHDHVSMYEFDAYRSTILRRQAADGMICVHCAKKRIDETLVRLEDLEGSRDIVMRIAENIFPFVYPDAELLDTVYEASGRKSRKRLRALLDLSGVIHAVRTSQAFNAPVILDEEDVTQIPDGLTSESDHAKQLRSSETTTIKWAGIDDSDRHPFGKIH